MQDKIYVGELMKTVKIDKTQIDAILERAKVSLYNMTEKDLKPKIYMDLLNIKLLGDKLTIDEAWRSSVIMKKVKNEEEEWI